MQINYLRSSSINTWNSCQQQYYLQYVLGFSQDTNKKTEMGSCLHKIMECLAKKYLCTKRKEKYFEDDYLGKVKISNFNLDKVIETCYNVYSKASSHEWDDLDTIKDWVNKAISLYDISKVDILEAEYRFNYQLPQDWADGIHLKGTIDLLVNHEDCIELVDYKTGARKNWVTNAKKDFEYLKNDSQLLLYFYVIRKIFNRPVCATIIYINAGGVFTIPFDDEDLIKAEEMIKSNYLQIQRTTKPNLLRPHPFCRFCSFSKKYFENPLTFRDGNPRDMCYHIKEELYQIGFANTTKKYMQNNGHHLENYTDGGGKKGNTA